MALTVAFLFVVAMLRRLAVVPIPDGCHRDATGALAEERAMAAGADAQGLR